MQLGSVRTASRFINTVAGTDMYYDTRPNLAFERPLAKLRRPITFSPLFAGSIITDRLTPGVDVIGIENQTNAEAANSLLALDAFYFRLKYRRLTGGRFTVLPGSDTV